MTHTLFSLLLNSTFIVLAFCLTYFVARVVLGYYGIFRLPSSNNEANKHILNLLTNELIRLYDIANNKAENSCDNSMNYELLQDVVTINVLGCSCSGKSTLTKQLSKLFTIAPSPSPSSSSSSSSSSDSRSLLQSFELDNYFWQPNWNQISRKQLSDVVYKLIYSTKDEHYNKHWILDGNYFSRDGMWDNWNWKRRDGKEHYTEQ